MIGIIFAMKEELDAFLINCKINKQHKIFDIIFFETIIDDKKIVLVESGIGKVNAARCTQVLINHFKIQYLFNIGVAGGVDPSLNVLDIVIGKSLVQHDFDITEFNHPKGYIPNLGINIESDEKLVKIAYQVSNKLNLNSKVGVIASGDIFITDSSMSKKINKKFQALCVEMEGASIAQVAYLSHVPFLVIRSISDVVSKDNIITYENFLNKSSLQVAKLMKEILKDLN